MTGAKGWMMIIGSWVLFIVGGLVVAGDGWSVDYVRLMEDGRRLLALADRWLSYAGWLAAGWVDAGRSAADGAASWISGRISGLGQC
jgi:hypothetical protein